MQKQLLGSNQLGFSLRRLVGVVAREVANSLSSRSVAVHATARFLNECAQPVSRSHVIRSQSWQEFFRLVHLWVRRDARMFTEPRSRTHQIEIPCDGRASERRTMAIIQPTIGIWRLTARLHWRASPVATSLERIQGRSRARLEVHQPRARFLSSDVQQPRVPSSR